jgi:hypothetical protein
MTDESGSLTMIRRLNRWDWLLLALALGALGVAAHGLWPEPPAFAMVASQTIDDAVAGQSRVVTYPIRNLTDRPIRVVGAGFT